MAQDVLVRFKADVNKFKKDLKTVKKDLGGVQKGVGSAQKQVGAFGNIAAGIGTKLAGIGAAIGGAFAIGAVIRNATRTIVDFEKNIASLQAITGATGQDLEFLKQKSIELGAASGIGAAETAKAFELIASAKPALLENGKALAEVTKQAIILSQASGLDLTSASNAVTTALNQFGLEADQTERAVNALAAGAKFGASAIPATADAIKRFGAVASGANISLEESVALVETLAEKQITAGEAGTGLRNVILRLQKAGKGFVDGQFNIQAALEQTRDELNAITDPIVRAQKETKLFGVFNVTAGKILLNNVDRFEKFKSAVTGTNVAVEQAAITQATLSAKTKQLGTTWEAFVLSLDNGSGVISEVARGFLEGTTKLVGFAAGLKSASEELEEERINLLGVQSQLFSVNTTTEERIKLIEDLQSQYPELLGNLDAEKVSNEDLRKAIQDVNDELVNRIIIQRKQEEIDEQQEKRADALQEQLEAEVELRKEVAKASELTPEFRFDPNLTEIENARKLFSELSKTAGTGAKVTTEAGRSLISLNLAIRGAVEADRILTRQTNEVNTLIDERTDLEERLKGASEDTREEFKKFGDELDDYEGKWLRRNQTDQESIRSIKTIKEALKEAKRNFEEAAIGSDKYNLAQQQIILLTKELNDATGKTAEELAKTDAELKKIEKSIRGVAVVTEDELLQALNAVIDETDKLQQAIKETDLTELFEDEEALNQVAFDREQELLNKSIENAEKAKEKDLEDAKSLAVAKQELLSTSIQASFSTTKAFLDRETELRTRALDNQIAGLEELRDKKIITEEQFAQRTEQLEKERSDLLRKAAERDKAIAIFESLVNTAVAVTSALKAPPPSNIPLSIAAGIAGAAQTASIIAQPIPEFAKGGWIDGKSHKQGGEIIEAEGGEFVVSKRYAKSHKNLLESVNSGTLDKYINQRYLLPALMGKKDIIVKGKDFTDKNLLYSDKQTRKVLLNIERAILESKHNRPRLHY